MSDIDPAAVMAEHYDDGAGMCHSCGWALWPCRRYLSADALAAVYENEAKLLDRAERAEAKVARVEALCASRACSAPVGTQPSVAVGTLRIALADQLERDTTFVCEHGRERDRGCEECTRGSCCDSFSDGGDCHCEVPQEFVEYTDIHKVWRYPNGTTLSIERCLLDPEDSAYLRPEDQPRRVISEADAALQNTINKMLERLEKIARF